MDQIQRVGQCPKVRGCAVPVSWKRRLLWRDPKEETHEEHEERNHNQATWFSYVSEFGKLGSCNPRCWDDCGGSDDRQGYSERGPPFPASYSEDDSRAKHRSPRVEGQKPNEVESKAREALDGEDHPNDGAGYQNVGDLLQIDPVSQPDDQGGD